MAASEEDPQWQKMYVHFSKPESYRTFENEISKITDNTTTMGIEELILHQTEQKGIEKGKIEEVHNLIIKLGLSDEQAADVAGVTVAYVQKVRAGLEKK